MIKLIGGPFDGREVVKEGGDFNYIVYRSGRPIQAIYKNGKFDCYKDVPSDSKSPAAKITDEVIPPVEPSNIPTKKKEKESENENQSKEDDEEHLGDFT